MEKIIATVVGIILVLGLIAYAILGQADGVKNTGDKANVEQQKISLMLQDPNIVTGNTVKSYSRQLKEKVSVCDKDGSKTIEISNVKDGALFSMKKTYDANGDLSEVEFTQVDLSSAEINY